MYRARVIPAPGSNEQSFIASWTDNGKINIALDNDMHDLIKEYVPKVFKLEYGKRYVSRAGYVTSMLVANTNSRFTFTGKVNGISMNWTESGSYSGLSNHECPEDLVREYHEPVKTHKQHTTIPEVAVAFAVREWLAREEALQFVPWALDPNHPQYSPDAAKEQTVRNRLLTSLKDCIMDAVEKTKQA